MLETRIKMLEAMLEATLEMVWNPEDHASTLLVLLAAIYLHLGGVEADNKNIFYYNNRNEPNIAAYVKLLEELRSRLASGTDVHGIAVTRPPTNITFQERFIQVQLENGGGDVIIVIINRHSKCLCGFPQEIELGHGALNNAITNLFNERSTSNSKKRALLVIIQMVAEAVRIRYIEHLIRRNMLGENPNFILDPRVISMENRWSDPSEQIQWSGESGIFLREIQVQSVSNEVVRIRNVQDTWSLAALALMLYRSVPEATKLFLYNAGTIMNPRSGLANGANALVWLANCVIGTEPRQQLYGDRTIRLYSDRTLCVTSDGDDSLDSIILLKCQGSGNQRWTFMADGTILNPNSRLVMDVQNSDVSLQEIILYQPTGNPNQNWLAF
ncbi:ribosome-inactivating protein [Tanacetum coccineum]|uniref:Ribosome-inactivating protein n=1 Tax=Tanacetum coccineum TaxID=301880 RepID=A0ABQ5ACK3_9ASTR